MDVAQIDRSLEIFDEEPLACSSVRPNAAIGAPNTPGFRVGSGTLFFFPEQSGGVPNKWMKTTIEIL